MILNTLYTIIGKITQLWNSLFGWGLALFSFIVAWLGDSATSFACVGLAVVIDAIWGVAVSVKRGDFVLSHLLRETMNKLFIYSTTLCMVLFIERSINEDWYIATKIVCAIASSCELWSICANILIIKPNTPFIKLFRRYLAGEISKKIGITVEEFNKENEENERIKK